MNGNIASLRSHPGEITEELRTLQEYCKLTRPHASHHTAQLKVGTQVFEICH